MKEQQNRKWGLALTAVAACAVLCLALAPAAGAQEVAKVRAYSGGIDFQPVVGYGSLVLTVSGPDGFTHRAEFKQGESPAFSIFEEGGGVLPDGAYNYDLWVIPSDAVRREAFEANQSTTTKSRGGIEPLVQSGSFSIVAGAAVAGGDDEAQGDLPAAGNRLATKTQVINMDLIVQGSECVGLDCTSSESFGFDTLRLKENNTRIKFEDTSSSAGFPSNDWQLTANDSASGGQNKFSIDDVTGAKVPFTVEAGATTNSIYVDSTGRVGFRTSTPVLDLHVATSNTPGLRLEQTSAGGFTAQTWDVAGNEANFFVRSVTTGSQLPFRIRPGAPTSSIDIANDGDVGIGDSSPDDRLDVEVGSSNGGVTIESTVDGNLPQLTLIEPTRTWRFRVSNNGNFVFTDATAGTTPVQLVGAANTSLLIVGGTDTVSPDADRVTVNGELFIGTSMVTPDYVFEPDFELESIEEHAEYMWTHKHLPAVGGARVSGDQHLIDVGATQFGMLEELEKAHVYIEQLHGSLKAKADRIDQLSKGLESKDAELRELSERVARLEAAVEPR